MRLVGWLAVVAVTLFLAGCTGPLAQSFGPACQLGLVGDVALIPIAHGSEIVIPAIFGAVTLPIMLDTGAQSTMVSESVLPAPPAIVGHTTITGVGGARLVPVARISPFRIGGLADTLPVLISEEPWFLRRAGEDAARPAPAAGLLGMDWLSGFDADLDIPAHRLRLFRPRGRCEETHVALAPPIYAVPDIGDALHPHAPRINVMIDDTLFVALIDTGAQRTSIFRNDAARIGVTAGMLAQDRPGQARGVAGTITVHEHLIQALHIGDLTLTNIPMHVLDQDSEDGVGIILGMDFISRVHLWLSQSSRTIAVQFPPAASPEGRDEP